LEVIPQDSWNWKAKKRNAKRNAQPSCQHRPAIVWLVAARGGFDVADAVTATAIATTSTGHRQWYDDGNGGRKGAAVVAAATVAMVAEDNNRNGMGRQQSI
jgi:hypothetical protein